MENTTTTTTTTETNPRADAIAKALEKLFKPVKTLRVDLSPAELESKTLLEKNKIALPPSYFITTVPLDEVYLGIALLNKMLPAPVKTKRTGGKPAGDKSESKQCPLTGWIGSKRNNLRTARRKALKTFCIGKRFAKVFPELVKGIPLNFDPVADIANYAATMTAYATAILQGGSTEGKEVDNN